MSARTDRINFIRHTIANPKTSEAMVTRGNQLLVAYEAMTDAEFDALQTADASRINAIVAATLAHPTARKVRA